MLIPVMTARAAFSQRRSPQWISPATESICTRLQNATLLAGARRLYAIKASGTATTKSSANVVPAEPTSPFAEDFLKRKPKVAPTTPPEVKKEADKKQRSAKRGVQDATPSSTGLAGMNQMPERGKLAPTSFFADEFSGPAEGDTPGIQEYRVDVDPRNPEALAATLIPRPWARARWQRKKVIQNIRKRGRLNKAQTLLRTERSSLSKSHFLKTSVKKLGPLARQIAGKRIDDAILQMRFSKKKAAKEVLTHLEAARDQAIVSRGLGLGDKIPEHLRPADEIREDATPSETFPKEMRLKNGRRHSIKSPYEMYVSQAWVGRGPYGRELDHRARGQINMLRPPYTSISVLLKEEKTRLREAKERDARDEKKRREKMWVQLPDKSIPGQRQYYSW